jgi:hypothetical protein
VSCQSKSATAVALYILGQHASKLTTV